MNNQGALIQLVAHGSQNNMFGGNRQSKVINCIESFDYGLFDNKEYKTTRYLIQRFCDTIDNFYLYSDLGYDIIDYIELEIGGQSITKISGHSLKTFNILNGNKKIMFLPFHNIKMVALQYHEVRFNLSYKYIENIFSKYKNSPNNKYVNIITEYLINNLSIIVMDYVGGDCIIGNMKLYTTCNFLNTDMRRKIAISTHIDIIDEFQEHFEIIEPNTANIKLDLHFYHLSKSITITFTQVDDFKLLPILKSGVLRLNNMIHTEFTGMSSWIIDKQLFNKNVPDKPIYTITFDADL